MLKASRLQAVIFDLDGVLADTAVLHHRAWSRLAAELGFEIDAALAERLKGLDREASLDLVLGAARGRFSAAVRRELAQRKNASYVAMIEDLTPEHALPGAHAALQRCRELGLSTALASASRNAPVLVRRLGFDQLLDAVADPSLAASKPEPDIFLQAARLVGAEPDRCAGVEDSISGLRGIRAAGMYAVGIGDPRTLAPGAPDAIVSSVSEFAGRLV